MFIYLSLEEVMALHKISIEEFGGTDGLRDLGLLESAVYQPQQSFAGDDLYPDLWMKAAAIGYSISENQPFLDGNKRTAALSMLVFLDTNGYELDVPQGEVYKAIMELANKRWSREHLASWLQTNSKHLKPSASNPRKGKK